jgi:hypothetical protein
MCKIISFIYRVVGRTRKKNYLIGHSAHYEFSIKGGCNYLVQVCKGEFPWLSSLSWVHFIWRKRAAFLNIPRFLTSPLKLPGVLKAIA